MYVQLVSIDTISLEIVNEICEAACFQAKKVMGFLRAWSRAPGS